MKNNTKRLRRVMRKSREYSLDWANQQNLQTVISAARYARRELKMTVSSIANMRKIMTYNEEGTAAWRSNALALAKYKKRAAGLAGELAGYRAVSCARVQGIIE